MQQLNAKTGASRGAFRPFAAHTVASTARRTAQRVQETANVFAIRAQQVRITVSITKAFTTEHVANLTCKRPTLCPAATPRYALFLRYKPSLFIPDSRPSIACKHPSRRHPLQSGVAALRSAAVAPARASRSLVCSAVADYREKAPKDTRVLVVGPTGYIGKYVVKELIARGYNVVAFSREKAGVKGKMSKDDTVREFAGALRAARCLCAGDAGGGCVRVDNCW